MHTRLVYLVAVLAFLIAACGQEDRGAADDTTPPDPTTTIEETTSTEEATATTESEGTDGVHAAETDLGTVLVDGEGFTLYIFTDDTDGESTCYDACAELWPPVPGDVSISADIDESIFGTTTRDDGSTQLTVNEMPLYRYSPDTAPGDTNGHGFNDVWFVVDGEGSVIEGAADDNEVIDYGY